MSPPPAPPARPAPGEARVLAAACLATTLVPLSSTMVAVALPDVRTDFGIGVEAAVWLVSAYLITTAAAQPVAGSLGDRLGRRTLVLGGIAGFGLTALVAAVAPTYAVAVAARCVQAMCGALALVNVAASVRLALPPDRRGRSFGLIGAAATLSAASGPPLGSAAVAVAGWRGTFLAVLPLVVVAFVAVARWLPAGEAPAGVRAPGSGAGTRPAGFDVWGALLLLATLGAGALAVNQAAAGRPPAVELALAGATVAAGLAFAAVERAHPAPVLDLRVLRVRAVAVAGLAIGASNLAMYLVLLAVPLLLAGRDAGLSAGAVLAPMLFGAAVTAPFGGRLADRYGRRAPAVAGNVLLAASMAALVPLDLHEQVAATTVLLGAAGVGLGLSTAAMQTAGAEALPPEQAGVAAGLTSAARYLGSILGTALLALLVGDGSGRAVFAVAAAAAALSALAAAGLRPGRSGRPAGARAA